MCWIKINKVNKRGAILLLSLIISIQLCISAPFFAEEMILNQMLLVFFLQLLIKKKKKSQSQSAKGEF